MSTENNSNTQKPAEFNIDSLQKNPKFITTVKTFVIYGTIMYVVNSLVGMVLSAFSFGGYLVHFNVFALVMAIITGLIGMAIGGAVFYFVYEPVKNWVKRTPFLAKHLTSMFNLFWKPYLIVIVITAVFALLNMLSFAGVAMGAAAMYGAPSFGGFFIGWIVSLAVEIGLYYWYAKTVSAKLEPLYPW